MRRLIVLCVAISIAACSPSNEEAGSTTSGSLETSTTSPITTVETTTTTLLPDFSVSSPAFTDGGSIPVEFTCDGTDVNPPLEIVGIPEGTGSLVIIVDDPDAPIGTWDHWVEFDIPAGSGSFDVPRDSAPLGTEAVNSWHLEGYMGPCPPEGDDAHTYRFAVHAVDGFLGLPSGVDSDAVRSAIEDLTIASVETTGTYAR